MNIPPFARYLAAAAAGAALVILGACIGRQQINRAGEGSGGLWQFHEWGGGILLVQPSTGRLLHWAGRWIELTPPQLGGPDIYTAAPTK